MLGRIKKWKDSASIHKYKRLFKIGPTKQRSVGVRQHDAIPRLVLPLLSKLSRMENMSKSFWYASVVSLLVLVSLTPGVMATAHIYEEPLRAMPPEAEQQRLCLAKNIYFEAGNQSVAGKVAVANVTMNRVTHHRFPGTICNVVYQGPTYINWKGNEFPKRGRCQFSWYCDGKKDEPLDSRTWLESLRIADAVLYMEYQDISDGALWYHASYVEPAWSKHLHEVMTVDDHIFYR